MQHATLELRPVLRCPAEVLTPTYPLPPDAPGQDVLPTADGTQACLVGPTGATQDVLDVGSAQAGLDSNGQWVVTVDLRPEGVEVLNAVAARCFEGDLTCPSRQLAIVVDGVIQSAPTVETPSFPGTLQISGGFTEDEVRTLARTLNGG